MKSITSTIIQYQAEDGTMFSTKELCAAHEQLNALAAVTDSYTNAFWPNEQTIPKAAIATMLISTWDQLCNAMKVRSEIPALTASHPHQVMMDQAEADPSIKWQLLSRDGVEWHDCSPIWVETVQYRQTPHPHQDLMDQAKADPSIEWQLRNSIGIGHWIDCKPEQLWLSSCQYRQKPHPHQTLIDQAKADRSIEWQLKRRGSDWQECDPWRLGDSWDKYTEYRQKPHPHQDLMDQAKDDPSIVWQVRARGSEWLTAFKPNWVHLYEYRRQPAEPKIDETLDVEIDPAHYALAFLYAEKRATEYTMTGVGHRTYDTNLKEAFNRKMAEFKKQDTSQRRDPATVFDWFDEYPELNHDVILGAMAHAAYNAAVEHTVESEDYCTMYTIELARLLDQFVAALHAEQEQVNYAARCNWPTY
jgi:hypothetical protein